MNKERNLLKLLSDKECIQASGEAIKNAKIHKQTAESTAVYENYGIAVSHLILSTEELIKGLLLYTQGLGLDVRNISGIHLFFTDHIIKHRLATLVSTFYPILQLFMGIIYKMRDKLHNPDLEVEYTENENALLNRDETKMEAIFSDISEMMDWWDEANENKNKGFYVDYSKMLETPMQVTKLEYTQAFTITDSLKNKY